MTGWDGLPYDGRIHGDKLVDGHEIDFVIDLLVMENTAMELREMARELGVSRPRGASKRETASEIAHVADHKLEVVEAPDGTLEVRPRR